MRELKLGDLLSDAFEIYKTDIGQWLLASLVFAVMLVISYFLCFVPALFVGPPLVAGMFLISLNHIRHKRVEVGDLFKGFEYFGPALVTGLAVAGISLLCYLPAIIFQLIGAAIIESSYRSGVHTIGMVFSGLAVLLYLAGMIPIFYFLTRFIFIFPLIVDKNLGFQEAYRMSKEKVQEGFWNALLIYIVSGVIGSIGAIICGIGYLLTLPMMFLMLALAYHRLFTPEIPTILSEQK